MTVKGGTTPACAVCKFQRRKCSPSCPLAPYFPASQPKMFQNVHRLFGVSSITKILEGLTTEDQKEDAMKSIIYEAEMRQRFPVHGCIVILSQLRLQIQNANAELLRLRAQLAACKEQMGFVAGGPMDVVAEPSFLAENDPVFLNESSVFYGNDDDASNLMAVQAQMGSFGIHQEERNDVFFQDFEGAVVVDDRQSYVAANGGVEMSPSESSTKEITTTAAVNNISESDLKNAAAAFSLTTNRLSNF